MNDFFGTVFALIIFIPLAVGAIIVFVSVVTIVGITAHKMLRQHLSSLK